EADRPVLVLATLSKLALEYRQFNKWAEALPLLKEIADIKKATLGPDHPDTVDAMSLVGKAHFQLRQFDEAISLSEQVLKGREAKLGPAHLDTLHSVANLGICYKEADRLTDAIPLLERVHRVTTKHPEFRWVTSQLHDAYTRAGESDKTVALLREQLAEAR